MNKQSKKAAKGEKEAPKAAAVSPEIQRLQTLRQGYVNNLNQTQQQIAQLSNTLTTLNNKVEQLRGAIYGLQELESQLTGKPAEGEAEAAPAKADKKEAKAAKSDKGEEKQAAEVTKEEKSESKEAASGAQS